jgi:hypothetical protein
MTEEELLRVAKRTCVKPRTEAACLYMQRRWKGNNKNAMIVWEVTCST